MGRGMLVRMATALLLAAGLASAAASLGVSAGGAEAAAGKERPVMKVVRLLEDMKAELQRELDDDKQVHEKLACWCATGEKEKTAAIEAGDAKVEQLKSTMDTATAKVVELKEKRASTLAEVDADHAALSKASGLRLQESKAFQGEETDMMEAVAATKQAIVALSKHHPELAQVRQAAERLQSPRVSRFLPSSSSLRSEQLSVLRAFLRQASSASSFLAIPGYQSYRPQSGQIFGLLKQMQEDFEASLGEAQRAEMKAKADYEELKAAKEDEIASGRKSIVQLDADLAEFGEQHAQAAQELQDTQAQLELDTTFLANLQKKCAESSTQYDARVKSRLEEISAVEDTIGILNSDESFDIFDKSVSSASLLQLASVDRQDALERRKRASMVLRRAAGPSASSRLLLLATSAELDAFEKVKAEIDKMVDALGKQMTDEVAQRDWCTEEFSKNDRATSAAGDKKEALETKMADEGKAIETLAADIESARAAIAEMQEQMKRGSENREAENADFQQTVSDQRLTQMILQKAVDRMKQVYAAFLLQRDGQQPGAAHIATSGTKTDPGNGPARFTKYEQNAGGSRVVGLLEEVLGDSKKTEDEACASEADSQTAYENMMKDSNKAITQYMKSITGMQEAKATSTESMAMAKSDHKATLEDLGGLSEMLGDLHKSCDFVLNNFGARQEARSAEIESLKEAKAILSGMK